MDGARNPNEVMRDRAGFFLKKFCCPKNWEKGPKIGFSEFIEKFGQFYWICPVMKIYIICCVPTQIPYLGKILFLRYGLKCS